jgi:V/A-type H+-transporting ATPase subunit C
MREYDYFNARIKGMSTRLLPPAFFEEILTVPDPEGVVDALLNSTYGPALRDALAEGHDVPQVEAGLRRHLFEIFERIRSLAPPEASRLLAIPFRWWDLHNIVTILRGKVFEVEEARIVAGLFPAGFLDEARLQELTGEPDAVAVADTLVLWDIPGASTLRQGLRESASRERFSRMEAALIREHFSWALGQCEGPGENSTLMRESLRRQIDLVNVLTALRHVRTHPDGDTDFEPVSRGRLASGVVTQLAASPDLDTAIEVLAGTYFAERVERGIFAFSEHQRIGALERFLEHGVLEAGCRLFRADPLGIGVVVGFMWRQLNEFLNLRILLRGKAYGRPAVAIQEDLFLV